MSHTCGRRQVQGLADYLARSLEDPMAQGLGAEAWLRATLERATLDAAHIAACMAPGADDPTRTVECPACGDTGPHPLQAPHFSRCECAVCGEVFEAQ